MSERSDTEQCKHGHMGECGLCDTERLDWLQDREIVPEVGEFNGPTAWYCGDSPIGYGTLREAIDAAMDAMAAEEEQR